MGAGLCRVDRRPVPVKHFLGVAASCVHEVWTVGQRASP